MAFCRKCGATIAPGNNVCGRCGAAVAPATDGALRPNPADIPAGGMTTERLQAIYPEWEVVKLLGEGSFGQVYQIRRDMFGKAQNAALKVIRIPQNESERRRARGEGMDDISLSAYFHGFVQSLSDEIDLLSRLKGNSNIVSYEDHKIVPHEGEVGWTILIRMELLTPLLDDIQAHPFSQRDVLRLGLDLCKALALCERERIIHRDIKPDNIFVSAGGDFKLGDFGVARELEQTASGLSRKGTYHFMAPEVFHGRAYNATVDIYSLGVVLYTLLNSGRTPFLPPMPAPITAADREQAQQKLLSGEDFPPLEGVAPDWNPILATMCAYAPQQRYQTAGEAAEALRMLEKALDGSLTVSLWNGDRTPRRSSAPTEREASVWIDGTPVKTAAQAPQQPPASAAPSPAVANAPTKKKTPRWVLPAALAAAVLIVAGGILTGVLLHRNQAAKRQALLRDYYAQTLALSQAADFASCASYVNEIAPALPALAAQQQNQQRLGEIYYMQGNSYFELEQYDKAIASYETAKRYFPDHQGIQRDMAIAYARGGNIDRAESFLQTLRTLPDSESDIALLRGEISFAKQNYADALTQLRNYLALPGSDNYEKYRAYLLLDKACRKLGGQEKENIALLQEALRVLPEQYAPVLKERLADAYSRNKQYQEAVSLFEQLRDGGDQRFGTLQNIGLLYQQMKQYDKARAAFDALRAAFPDRYEAPMRLAFLVIAEQGAKANEKRDYAEALPFFDRAKALYAARPAASGDDPDMGRLESLIGDLRSGGWFDDTPAAQVVNRSLGGNHNSIFDLELTTKAAAAAGVAPTAKPQKNAATSLSVGQTYHFGAYDWIVLARESGKALLLTKTYIEERQYHETEADITWETSDIRRYLNGALYNKFSEAEKARIIETKLDNPDNPWENTEGGRATNDRIFLLNIQELFQYFGKGGAVPNNRGGVYDALKEHQDALLPQTYSGEGGWWLRSPGRDQSFAFVDGDKKGGNEISITYANVCGYYAYVRPAMWIKL
ncbi:MAG: DUF6273 domain-containing protein [Oscillospiraceae bacterium]|jgi:serine/threonine protein kinase/Tfp pilus assembly protein PilF|nr:DUF6273 domain-containing protein [Oscillospiraceae bacterium]